MGCMADAGKPGKPWERGPTPIVAPRAATCPRARSNTASEASRVAGRGEISRASGGINGVENGREWGRIRGIQQGSYPTHRELAWMDSCSCDSPECSRLGRKSPQDRIQPLNSTISTARGTPPAEPWSHAIAYDGSMTDGIVTVALAKRMLHMLIAH